MNSAQYAEYLKSPEWAERRKLVMQRAAGICEGCRKHPATEVDHLTYKHVTREFLFELVAICGGCHARYHNARPKPHTAQAARGRLSVLAAQARAELMALPLQRPPPRVAERMAAIARRSREERPANVSRETGDAA